MMTFIRILLASVALTVSGFCLEGDSSQLITEITTSPEMVTIASDTATVPEPSSAFFAGIGGLALLFFILRRRTSATY